MSDKVKIGAPAPWLRKSKYVPVSIVASRWACAPVTVIRLIEDGSLSAIKMRGGYRVLRESVDEYEQNCMDGI